MSNDINITVLPADDPSKLRLDWVIYESPWCLCVILDQEPYLYHLKHQISLYDADIKDVCEALEIDEHSFRELLHWDLIDGKMLKHWLERIRKRKNKNGQARPEEF